MQLVHNDAPDNTVIYPPFLLSEPINPSF